MHTFATAPRNMPSETYAGRRRNKHRNDSPTPFSGRVATVVTMVSHSRNGRGRARGHVRSTAERKPAARHYRGGNHRVRGGEGPKIKGRSRHLVLKWILGLIAAGLAAGIGLFAFLYITTEVPSPEKIALAENTTVYFSDGTTEMGTFSEQNRDIIDCAVLPDYVGNAVVASENRTFYTDKGIDLRGIGRALVNNVTKGTRQGGSTITQQYAERYYMGETTSYLGKLREAIMATKIAQTESKDTVLCNYMNTIYLGRGAYGIQAASKAYFGKEAKDLTVSEAAMLAGIIPAPSTWDPAKNPTMAEQRFDRVLDIMAQDGYITAEQKASAAMPTTIEYSLENVYEGTDGYLLRMVRDELTGSGAFTEDDLDTGGYRIVTTIQKDKQDLLYQSASPKANSMPDGVEAGAMSANPKDGSIIAIYAGEDYLSHQLNNATQATYEVGSTMKPFALLTAIQQGTSLDTVFNGNSPREFTGLGESMSNSGNVSYGYIDLYEATANSVNTVYMDLASHLGANFGASQIAATAKAAGVDGDITTDGSGAAYTVLGNDGLSVKDMTQAYATFANGGAKSTLHIVAQVLDTDGADLYKAPTATQQVFDANDVALLDKALTGVVESGTGKTLSSIGTTMAGKSGTANDNKAVSFIAFTPSMVTTVALWNPGQDGSAQTLPRINGYAYGMGYPVTLVKKYMSQALKGAADEKFPDTKDNGTVGGQDGTWGTGRKATAGASPSASPTDQPTDGASASAGAGEPSANATTPAAGGSSQTPGSGHTSGTSSGGSGGSGTTTKPSTGGGSGNGGNGDNAGGSGDGGADDEQGPQDGPQDEPTGDVATAPGVTQ